MIDPETGAEIWDVLRVSTMRSPGIVRLSGDGLKIGWDIQQATGSSGATTKPTGEPLKEFDAEFELSNEVDDLGISDFDRWDDFQAMLESLAPANGKPRAVDVFHPDLARVHITAVTLGSIGLMTTDGKGGGKIKVHFLEYRPPKPAKGPLKKATKTENDKKLDQVTADVEAAKNKYQKLKDEALAGPKT